MINFNMEVKYAMVFQREDLMEEEVLKDLSEYGTIENHYYDSIDDEDGCIPVMVVIINTSFGNGIRMKWDYRCMSATDNYYVLFPTFDPSTIKKKEVSKETA